MSRIRLRCDINAAPLPLQHSPLELEVLKQPVGWIEPQFEARLGVYSANSPGKEFDPDLEHFPGARRKRGMRYGAERNAMPFPPSLRSASLCMYFISFFLPCLTMHKYTMFGLEAALWSLLMPLIAMNSNVTNALVAAGLCGCLSHACMVAFFVIRSKTINAPKGWQLSITAAGALAAVASVCLAGTSMSPHIGSLIWALSLVLVSYSIYSHKQTAKANNDTAGG